VSFFPLILHFHATQRNFLCKKSVVRLEFLGGSAGEEFSPDTPVKMNAAAEVLRLRHWPPRGVYTRWRPRKRFCSGIVCIPPTSARKLSALRSAVCSKLDICSSIFCYFPRLQLRRCPRKAKRTSQFQNGILTAHFANHHGMATSVTSGLRASLRVRILTPGHSQGGRVARYFLLSLAFNSSCENRAAGVQSRLTRLRFG
jgi:hypothetical protein